MLLAFDIPPAPSAGDSLSFFGWLIAVLIGLTLAGATLYVRLRRHPKLDVEQPIAVREWREFATKEELSAAAAAAKADTAALAAATKAEDEKLHGRISGLRDDIRNDFDAKIARMDSVMDAKFSRIHERLDRLPSDLVTLLNNTRK
jgi:hypothetical protein